LERVRGEVERAEGEVDRAGVRWRMQVNRLNYKMNPGITPYANNLAKWDLTPSPFLERVRGEVERAGEAKKYLTFF